jgi:hypothetical protein
VKRIGPELKMPKLKGGEMKVPPFFSDLYADLRDRRLLPLVALILIAIVATPFLLGGASEAPKPVPAPEPPGGTEAAASGQSLTVVKSEPGLRNYKQRLSHRSPTDPFKQRFAGPRLGGGGLNEPTTVPTPPTETSGGGGGESETGSPPAPSGASGGEAAAGGNSGSHSNDTQIPGGTTIYTLEVTLQITRIETKPDGSVDKKGPTLFKDVQAPAALPGEKTPVITYLGMGSKGKVPMFLVSNEVTGIFGEANCISGAQTCQLLVLEEGFPVTFVYGENDVRYKINLLKAKPIITGRT